MKNSKYYAAEIQSRIDNDTIGNDMADLVNKMEEAILEEEEHEQRKKEVEELGLTGKEALLHMVLKKKRK